MSPLLRFRAVVHERSLFTAEFAAPTEAAAEAIAEYLWREDRYGSFRLDCTDSELDGVEQLDGEPVA